MKLNDLGRGMVFEIIIKPKGRSMKESEFRVVEVGESNYDEVQKIVELGIMAMAKEQGERPPVKVHVARKNVAGRPRGRPRKHPKEKVRARA